MSLSETGAALGNVGRIDDLLMAGSSQGRRRGKTQESEARVIDGVIMYQWADDARMSLALQFQGVVREKK
jgi:hypothetical protein